MSIGVLMGGWSAERSISLKSGHAVLAGLQRGGIDAIGVDLDGTDVADRLIGVERAFVVLHGRGGEDGVIQGCLEAMGIPYTGTGVLGSALAMDKLRSKQLWRGIGLPTPDWVVLDADSDPAAVVERLGLPLIVKPAREGSSIGMTRVDSEAELMPAWREAARYDRDVLAERWVNGTEYTIAVLDDRPLPAIRLETPRGFYDFEAKYAADNTRYHCPAGLDVAEETAMGELAVAAFRGLDGLGWGRVDVLRDGDGGHWLLEMNSVPGMTDHSLVPMAAAAEGMDFDALVRHILEASRAYRPGGAA
ncbi:MAG: D-alanine--D-alanine ligase [Pseudomonadota bacterium]